MQTNYNASVVPANSPRSQNQLLSPKAQIFDSVIKNSLDFLNRNPNGGKELAVKLLEDNHNKKMVVLDEKMYGSTGLDMAIDKLKQNDEKERGSFSPKTAGMGAQKAAAIGFICENPQLAFDQLGNFNFAEFEKWVKQIVPTASLNRNYFKNLRQENDHIIFGNKNFTNTLHTAHITKIPSILNLRYKDCTIISSSFMKLAMEHTKNVFRKIDEQINREVNEHLATISDYQVSIQQKNELYEQKLQSKIQQLDYLNKFRDNFIVNIRKLVNAENKAQAIAASAEYKHMSQELKTIRTAIKALTTTNPELNPIHSSSLQFLEAAKQQKKAINKLNERLPSLAILPNGETIRKKYAEINQLHNQLHDTINQSKQQLKTSDQFNFPKLTTALEELKALIPTKAPEEAPEEVLEELTRNINFIHHPAGGIKLAIDDTNTLIKKSTELQNKLKSTNTDRENLAKLDQYHRPLNTILHETNYIDNHQLISEASSIAAEDLMPALAYFFATHPQLTKQLIDKGILDPSIRNNLPNDQATAKFITDIGDRIIDAEQITRQLASRNGVRLPVDEQGMAAVETTHYI